MLPRSARLTSKRDFQVIYAKGRSFVADLIVIHVLPRGGNRRRFGFSVSTKLGNAVVRNRVKRRLREAIRSCLGRMREGRDVVVVARVKCKEASLGRIQEAIERLLRKAGLRDEDVGSSEGR